MWSIISLRFWNFKVVLKADEVPFTTDKYITNALGWFVTGESVKGLSIAEILAKLLGLTDKNPSAPQDVTIEEAKQNSIPVMQGATKDGEITTEDVASAFSYFEISEAKANNAPQVAEPGTSSIYEIKNASNEVIEHGYQVYTIKSGRGTYWRVSIAEGLSIKEVKMYDDFTSQWVAYTPTFTDTGERIEHNGYTYVVYQSSDGSSEEILRFVIE